MTKPTIVCYGIAYMSHDSGRAFDPHKGIEDRVKAIYAKNDRLTRVYAYLNKRRARASREAKFDLESSEKSHRFHTRTIGRDRS